MCLHVYDTHWSTNGCAKTVCLYSHLQICGRRCAICEIQLIDTVLLRSLAWGISSPDAMFDGHLHSSCSTAAVMNFPSASVCIVRGPPAFLSALGFTLNCHREMFLQFSFVGQCNMCSHESVLAGLLMALTLKNAFQYLLFDQTELCYALHVLGTPNSAANNAAEKCICSFVSIVCVEYVTSQDIHYITF